MHLILLQRVDCSNRQCNFTQEASNAETCQKCRDLEKCYNYEVRFPQHYHMHYRLHSSYSMAVQKPSNLKKKLKCQSELHASESSDRYEKKTT